MRPKRTALERKSGQTKAGAVCRWPAAGCLTAIRSHRRAGRERPVIMVSSSVFGIEPLLNQIEGVLKSVGWEVWMSKAGTIQVDSAHSAMVNCLHAVEDCDAFLGIITGRYGSGRDKHGVSFTHREMKLAIELDLKRWFLVQHEVVVSRSLCRSLGKVEPQLREKVQVAEAAKNPKHNEPGLKRNPHLDNWRILDMYDLAIRDGSGALEDRAGNWVQPYRTDDEAMLYVRSQLFNPLRLFPQYIPKTVKGAHP
jgi:hypothetical protein